jgi:hypothetical protein
MPNSTTSNTSKSPTDASRVPSTSGHGGEQTTNRFSHQGDGLSTYPANTKSGSARPSSNAPSSPGGDSGEAADDELFDQDTRTEEDPTGDGLSDFEEQEQRDARSATALSRKRQLAKKEEESEDS